MKLIILSEWNFYLRNKNMVVELALIAIPLPHKDPKRFLWGIDF